jgi:hypothetical protein
VKAAEKTNKQIDPVAATNSCSSERKTARLKQRVIV